MKKILLFWLVFWIGRDLAAQDPAQPAELEKRRHQSVLTFRNESPTGDYDLTYHRLEWEVDPAVRYISGRVTSYFVPLTEGFNRLHFDLESSMTVNEVTYRGKPVPFTLTGDDVLQIDLPQTLPAGVPDSVTLDYEGAPVLSEDGSFVTSAHDSAPLLWTLSEPYGAKDWWPCKQDLADKIDSIDILVTTPEGYRVGSNGLLVRDAPTIGNRRIFHWRHRYPIAAYLVSLAVTNYAEFTDYVYLENGDSIPILNYVYPEDLASAQVRLKSTVEQMELFNRLFGIYPFAKEKYGHAQFGWGGGMEHQTMSSMGGFSYDLQAHELAHQWFGNKVTCSSWSDIWLNEGSATYLSWMTIEFLEADPTVWAWWKASSILSVTDQPDGSVYVEDTTDVGRIFNYRLSYQKGALLLHMLRWMLGDEAFFQASRNYLDDPKLAYGYATTGDLKRHLEAVSGHDLTEFFADWYYGEGYPIYTVKYDPQPGGVLLSIEQKTSHPSVDFFEMPIPVWLSDGARDTLLRLDHDFSGQPFEIELPFEPDTAAFDPDYWIVSRDNVVQRADLTDSEAAKIINAAVEISPNPARETFEIRFSDPALADEVEFIAVTDMNGRLIARLETITSGMTVDLAGRPAGTYTLTFHTEEGRFARQVVKME